jgi:hydroxyethylthiazole kinase
VKIGTFLNRVREKKPLVHHITNYVTMNDCANVSLNIGASPVMADAIEEAAEITSISSALVLNIGTLNERKNKSMLAAGKAANEKGIPVIFDPVGVGASKFRNETAAQFLNEIKLTVLRGNISEIKFLAGLGAATKGVDASENDAATANLAGQIAKNLAAKLKCVVVISGATDIISDGEKIFAIENGHAMLGNLTGTGCMCSSLIGCFCGANPIEPFSAAIAAMVCAGIAGEIAQEKAGRLGGGSFHTALHDAVSLMNAEILERREKFHETKN